MFRKPATLFCALVLASCSYLPEPPVTMDGIRMDENRDFLLVEPLDAGRLSGTGLLFYPGGLVDPHAYLPLASAFARSGNGHRVIIVKMPANLAVLDVNAAHRILEEQEMEKWVIAGHSLGGAMACSMVDNEPGLFSGLILMAAYPASSVDLTSWDGPVLSISASEDRVVDQDNYEEGRERLPPVTQYEVIEGGNHAGFGQYGEQKGDGVAEITGADQQALVIELIQSFITEHGLE